MDISGLAISQQQAAKQIISKCIVSRKYFIKEILGVELEKWQEEVLDELDSGVTKKSIRSGHGVGKTMFCAVTALHFLCFRDDVRVIVTAPSADQMKDGLIPEINKWINRLPVWMSKSIGITSERIVRYPSPANNFISFRTARKENPNALAGVHATHVMIIVDEASGVDEAVYETGQGSLSTEGSIALLIGNPTNPSGFFYKTQNELSDVWRARRVSCYDSTQVDPEYIAYIIRAYGADSREYRVRVLGEFPDSAAEAVIPRSFAEAAVDRDVTLVRGDTIWGIDPGRGGDPTGFAERDANFLVDYRELNYVDLMQVVGWVKNRYDAMPFSHRPIAIYVDSIGLGAGVADRLLELDMPVVHVNVSEAAAMSDRYTNLRAELWYKMREWLEHRDCCIIGNENQRKLVHELSSVNQKYMSNGKVLLESKVEMKKRGISSPNMADALAITFCGNSEVRIGQYEESWGKVDVSKYRVPGIARRRHRW